MKETLSKLDSLYDSYLADMAPIEQEQAGLLGLVKGLMGGGGSSSDSCNTRFSSGMQDCLSRFAQSEPSSADALGVMRYVIEQPRMRPCGRSSKLMLQAVAAYLIPMAELLTPPDAASLLSLYSDILGRRPPLPAQQELKNALKRQAQ